MNIYRFQGFCLNFDCNVICEDYKVVKTAGNHYYAEVKSNSLRKAVSLLKLVLGDREYVISRTYTVTNPSGKASARILR